MSGSLRNKLCQAELLGITKELCVGFSTRYLLFTRCAQEEEGELLVMG